MNAGFSSLRLLKAYLLNESLRSDTTYDDAIRQIGLGMAAAMERFCNRKFARVVGDTFEIRAGRKMLILPRYPVEAVTALDMRTLSSETWATNLSALNWFSAESGLVQLGLVLGTERERIRVTFTGGYWWDQSEDALNPDTQPGGSTEIPEAIRGAWFLQCEHVWRRRDKLGISLASTADDKPAPGLADLARIPLVADMLRPFVRYVL